MTAHLPEQIADELVAVADALADVDVLYQLGGSAMLVLSGIDVEVNDIDVVVDLPSPSMIIVALAGWEREMKRGGRGPFQSEWILRAARGGSVDVEVMSGLTVEIDGEMARFPVTSDRHADVRGRQVPLAPLEQWYHLYRAYDPPKATAIAQVLDPGAIDSGARDLGLTRSA